MPTAVDERRRDAFAERVFTSSIVTLEMLSIYLGDRLGFYRALSDGGAATSSELAARAGTHERYTREWLEQQAVAGIIDADGGDGSLSRRYALDPAHAEVLADQDSLSYLVPLARLTASPGQALDTLIEAYRTGAGVAWSAYGGDARVGQAGINRPAFLQLLGREWLPAVPDVHARLGARPPVRVADIGCGEGWSAIGIAQAYPYALVDGFDLDEPSLARAREHAANAGLADRVRFEARDAASLAFEGRYDLVTIFEALHDMARPVEALRAARGMLTPGGATIVVDEPWQSTSPRPATKSNA